ncbi:MAG: Eco57I restriction-modification methylase domain-containing protein [Verrucomicrobia bacterium]|nr:Eco57I restriction-modification methylase domain-containing protein [Verrucomicrobiota bacterium]
MSRRRTANYPTLAQIEDAFSVEAVTKEFFNQYAALFGDIEAALRKLAAKDPDIGKEFKAKNVSTVDFAKKLMGQIVFLYFLQKKGWLGVAKGQDWGTGPHDFLRRLCRGDHGAYGNFFNDVLEPLFYDTLATDRGHEAWCNRFKCRIPFLNGGLFEPMGDYDWRKTDITLPNKLFTNTERNDAGDIGTGVLDVFDRYNFTVNEAEPLEKEVAIDPEMLGKVFENLIEENRRKGLGSFYTPREIVHYMCQESLINYLDTALNTDKEIVPRKDIETFIYLGEQISHYEAVDAKYPIKMPATIEKHARLIDEKLADITVCDPAVGSGAYPVGMMTEIVRARCALTPYFNDVHDRTPYHFKRHAIQNSLYGVDIDPGAVEIAKLRLWLSLVVDEEDVKQIKPLPNLDYKIVTGNSLLGVEKNLFNQQLFQKLEKLKPLYFDQTDSSKKSDLKQQIDQIIHELTDGKEAFDFEIYFSEVFHTKKGFNVVIANPPYVRVQNLSHDIIDAYKAHWTTAWKRIDISTLFMELAMRICSRDGNAVFISSNQFLATEYGRKTREFFLRNSGFTRMLDLADLPVFEDKLTYVSIFFQQPKPTPGFDYARVKTLPFTPVGLSWERIASRDLSANTWVLGTNTEGQLVSKLASQNPRLDQFAKCWAGLFTGLDDILLFVEGDERMEDLESDALMPVLRAQSCDRFSLATPTRFPGKLGSGSTWTGMPDRDSTNRSTFFVISLRLMCTKLSVLDIGFPGKRRATNPEMPRLRFPTRAPEARSLAALPSPAKSGKPTSCFRENLVNGSPTCAKRGN